MEQAPLTAAHTLARSAYASVKDAPTAQQHHRAAAEKFVEAGSGVQDSEALRILSLLGEHHQRLARTASEIREPAKSGRDRTKAAQPRGSRAATPSSESISTTAAKVESTKVTTKGDASLPEPVTKHPISPTVERRLQRDTSSTIASSLATARGIPTGQQRATLRGPQPQDVHSKPTPRDRLNSPSAPPHSGSERPSQARDELEATLGKDNALKGPPSNPTAADVGAPVSGSDDAFQRFYSTFEGLLNKISAPLAFAGLPLGTDEQLEPTSARPTVGPEAAENNVDPDKLFSPAAMRAMRGGVEQGPGVQDSFYVVPPGGGTVSYAGMLARERKHARHMSSISSRGDREGDDQFVDAPEMPQSSRSGLARRTSAYRSPSSNKTFEELEEENAWLKQLTDELSHKVWTFEKDSQSKRKEMMQQSMRLNQRQARDTTTEPDRKSDGNEPQRTKGLEEQVSKLEQLVEKRDKEIRRQKEVIDKYRERWHGLLGQARAKRDSAGAAAKGIPQTIAEDT